MLPIVPVSPIPLDDYAEPAGEEALERLVEAARPLRGARIVNINSTGFGGGVAELLVTHLGLMQSLGIDAVWQLLQGSEEFFAVTKDMHNGLQGAAVGFDAEMRTVYHERLLENAELLAEPADFTFVHDPQPCGLLPILEDQDRRSGKWLWRCHIDSSAPQRTVWDFLVPMINRYDAAVFTLPEYAGPGIDGPTLAYITPTIDPLSTKNVYMDPGTTHAVLRHYGIDRRRPFITQVSRFDPWKDPIGVIDAYRLAKKKFPDVQLILVGSMAHDDPEGWEFLTRTQEHADSDPDVHLLTNMEQVGNLTVNAFQRASTLVVQKSLREGFGLTVSEALWKKRAVIAGNVGGIRVQIEDGVSGYLVDSVEECAERMIELLGDPTRRSRMGKAGHERVRDRFLSIRELESYLRLMTSL